VSLLTDRLDLNWSRRWTYYRSVQSLLVNDQSHKIQLKALSRLILRLVNQEMGGFSPLISSYWSSRSWIPSTERIHKSRNTIAHKVKHETLNQFNVEAGGLVNEPTNRSVQFHCLEDEPNNRSVQSYNLRYELTNRSVHSRDVGDRLTNRSVWSHKLEDKLTNRSV
jgi:hypothetical protein